MTAPAATHRCQPSRKLRSSRTVVASDPKPRKVVVGLVWEIVAPLRAKKDISLELCPRRKSSSLPEIRVVTTNRTGVMTKARPHHLTVAVRAQPRRHDETRAPNSNNDTAAP